MKKRIFILFMCCIFVIMLSGCKKEEEVVPEEKVEENFAFVFSNDRVLYGINKEDKVIKLIKSDNLITTYQLYDVDNGYLYYGDSENILHKLKLDNDLKDEKLDLKLDNNTWGIKVDKGILMANIHKSHGWPVTQYNLENSKHEDLSIDIRGNDYFYKGTYYYITADDVVEEHTTKNRRLMAYNISTKETSLIENEANIAFAKDDKILYGKQGEIYLYDLTTKEKNKVLDDFQLSMADIIVLGNDNIVYFVMDNVFMKSNLGKITTIENLNKSKAPESEYMLYRLLNGKILIHEIDSYNCGEDGCDDEENIFYIYDINSNTLTESKEDYSSLVNCSEVIYYKK